MHRRKAYKLLSPGKKTSLKFEPETTVDEVRQ